MNKQAIHHIIRRHYKKIKTQLNKIAANFDIEQIHQFRVTYKKLRAFLRMISLQKETAKLKISKKLKHCYHTAGLLRDLQLLQQHITEVTKKNPVKCRPYLDLLSEEMNRLKTGLSEIIAATPADAIERKINKNIPGKFPSAKINTYANEKLKGSCEMVAAAHFTEQTLHTIRKHLKDLYYNLKKHKTIRQHIVTKYTGNQLQFNQLLDELGNFHDMCAGLALLNLSRIKKLNKQQQQLLQQIKKEWTKEKAAMKLLLVTKLKASFSVEATA